MMSNVNNDFSDIAPFDNDLFHDKMEQLVDEPGFENAVKFVLPDIDYPSFRNQLLAINGKEELQKQIMFPFLEMLAKKTTDGITCDGMENISDGTAYTFITNHRDIVLDASFLNLCFLRAGKPTSEIAIGNNLLIYDWISDLVRLNKSFIVKRNLPISRALEAAMQLSGYIHFAVSEKHESVWIAQREGRAKDSNDLTQESVIKMLAIAGDGDFIDKLLELNVCPVSISYEYDPNDYLKAREYLLKRLDSNFRKSQRDDLFSMETGLLMPKGRIHFSISGSVNDKIRTISRSIPKALQAKQVCAIIDHELHARYHIFPVNYIAFDLLHETTRFTDRYTPEEKQEFLRHIDSQLEKVDISPLSGPDRHYMYTMMLTMYANPLKNKLSATGEL